MRVKPPDVIVTARPAEPEEASEPKVGLVSEAPLLTAPSPTPGGIVEVDITPIHAAAEAAGLTITAMSADPSGIEVRCGRYVPAFYGMTVAEVVAKINAYQCKQCGTGGGHNPNCGAKP